jgi:hypothetical protein
MGSTAEASGEIQLLEPRLCLGGYQPGRHGGNVAVLGDSAVPASVHRSSKPTRPAVRSPAPHRCVPSPPARLCALSTRRSAVPLLAHLRNWLMPRSFGPRCSFGSSGLAAQTTAGPWRPSSSLTGSAPGGCRACPLVMPRSSARAQRRRSPQMGGGSAFGMGAPPVWEYRRLGSAVDTATAPVIRMQRGLGIRQARRTAPGLSRSPVMLRSPCTDRTVCSSEFTHRG